MSQQKRLLAEAILTEVFGDQVGFVGSYLCQWKKASLRDIVASSSSKDVSRVADALAILIQHNLASFEQQGPTPDTPPAYALSLDSVLRVLRYPRYLLQVKGLLGDPAELLLDGLLKIGQDTASMLIYKAVSRRRAAAPDSSTEATKVKSEMQNGGSGVTKAGREVGEMLKAFKGLAEGKFISRLHTSEKEETQPSDDRVLFEMPDVQVPEVAAAVVSNSPAGLSSASDSGVLWRVNDGRFLAAARDQVLVAAITRRIDSHAGKLMKVILELVDEPWDAAASKHFYLTDVSSRISTSTDCTDTLKLYRDQYLKVLEEDRVRFVQRVGDEGGGAFEVCFASSFQSLAVAAVENAVLEKFGSKALRIFRVVRDRGYAEETQIQSAVMVPTKETKLLTYQLLENNFIHLQELRKSATVGSAHQKTFFLFYCDLNRVARMVLEMCYKATFNMLERQNHEMEVNNRLLEKQERIETIAANLKQSGQIADQADLDAQLQEVQEMLSPPETAQVRFVHSCLDKLRKAATQIDETVFVLDMYLALNAPV